MANRLCLLVALSLSSVVFAAEESAADISRKSRERGGLNLLGLTAELKLTTTAAGKSKEQVLSTSSKEIEGRTHSLARFIQPAGVAGVTLLTIEGKTADEGNAISLYLPKVKRVRQVAKSQRGQSFMDTDFSYADLGGTGGKDEDAKRKPDEKVDGRDCFVITGDAEKDSPYGNVTVWVDQETYVPLRADYADKDGKPFKQYRTLKLKKFKERVLAADSTMENLKTGSKTLLQILKLEEATLGDEAYSERALERG